MHTISKQLATTCTPEQWSQIEKFAELIKGWNKKVNVVSRKDIDFLIDHHVGPSFLFYLLQRLAPGERILDIGSGGGFPGIINAILFPDTEFFLVDSTKKKVTVMTDTIEKLGLTNVKAHWARVERLAEDKEYMHAFHRTTSRAVAPLVTLIHWSREFLQEGGTVEALKGGDLSHEITEAISGLHMDTDAITEQRLPKEQIFSQRMADIAIITAYIK